MVATQIIGQRLVGNMALRHSACETGFTITIYTGLTFNLPWVFQNPDGTDIDLTGKSIVFKLIFDDVTYTYTDVANSYGSLTTITDATNGEFTTKITDEETATFTPAVGKWALILQSGGDNELLYTDVAEIIQL